MAENTIIERISTIQQKAMLMKNKNTDKEKTMLNGSIRSIRYRV